MILPSLIHLSGHQIFYPFYHAVDDEDQPHIKHLYQVKTVDQFTKELDFLLKHFVPIDLDQLMQLHQNRSKPKKPSFFLSFDDGLRQCYEIIAPILLKKGIPATFFLNSAFIDNQDLMYRYKISLLIEEGMLITKVREDLNFNSVADLNKIDNYGMFSSYLKEHKPYMTIHEIKELEKKGFTIGGHSHEHPYYQDISIEEQINQTTTSLDYVLKHFSQKHSIFAFPFNDISVDLEFFNYLDNRIDLFFSTGGIKKDEHRKVIRRTTMENQDTISKYINDRYLKAYVKQLLKFRHIHRR